jgi:predicted regulator of Ras-like GTPase activity (Roadblock/LC7/MglB family)
MTPFGEILRHAVEVTPGALGGAFAAGDGETVDAFWEGDLTEWAILTAHYGVVLAQVQAALHTFHFGEAELVVISAEHRDVLMHAVGDGYYALLVIEATAPLAPAMSALERATRELREELG